MTWCFSFFIFNFIPVYPHWCKLQKSFIKKAIFPKVCFIKIYKTPLANSKSMQVFMALVPTLFQVNGKTVPPGESITGNLWQRLWIRFKELTPNVPARLNFYRCHSCTIQQARGKIKREKLFYIYNNSMW